MQGADPRVAWPFHPSSGVGAPSAGVGEGASLGPLSVPPAWTMIASEVASAPPPLPAFSVDAAPPVVPRMSPGRTFQQALMATMTGRDAWPGARRRRTLDQRRAPTISSATPSASAMIDTCGLTSGQLGRIEASV